jgi:Spy/CpxP family protein refolding chaperone
MKLPQTTFKQLIAIVSISVLLPAMAQAQPSPDERGRHCHEMEGLGHHGGPMGFGDGLMRGGGPVPPFLHGIDLTEAQREAVFTIMHNQAPVVRAKGKALQKAHEAMRAMSLSDKYDEAQSRLLAQEIADNAAALVLLHSRAEHEVYAQLTPEQRKQVGERKIKGEFQPVAGRSSRSHQDWRAM